MSSNFCSHGISVGWWMFSATSFYGNLSLQCIETKCKVGAWELGLFNFWCCSYPDWIKYCCVSPAAWPWSAAIYCRQLNMVEVQGLLGESWLLMVNCMLSVQNQRVKLLLTNNMFIVKELLSFDQSELISQNQGGNGTIEAWRSDASQHFNITRTPTFTVETQTKWDSRG